jgi:uncharacterized phage protein (TIGR01671 family)
MRRLKMRDIKFRAWDMRDKENPVMLPWGHIKYGSMSLFWKEENLRDYILMQYTGLKDKNGTEIYEGDVIRMYSYLIKPTKTPYIIEFKLDGSVGYVCRKVGGVESDVWALNSGQDLEVIGNIHENKELLDG